MRWTLKPKPSEETVKHLAKALNVEDFVATLLVQRGINTLRKQERPSLKFTIHFLMKDMEKAVSRIETAIENGENILVLVIMMLMALLLFRWFLPI
jgi:single-stranded-DNA-specific exonuclease